MINTQQPKEYVVKTVSSDCKGKLDSKITESCNAMLKEGFVYVDTIANMQLMSVILLFAKY